VLWLDTDEPASSAGLLPLGGTTGQVLAKIDGTDYNTQWSTPSGGGGVTPFLTLISGQSYQPINCLGSSANITATEDATYYSPFFVPISTTFDRLRIRTASSFAGTASVRLGIFNDTNGVPSTVVLDAGTVSATASSTNYSITISQTLSAGMYWLAANSQTVGSTNTYIGNNDISGPNFGFPRQLGSAFASAYRENSVTGAFATSSSVTADTRGIVVEIRVA
jgi:hypothetical protein